MTDDQRREPSCSDPLRLDVVVQSRPLAQHEQLTRFVIEHPLPRNRMTDGPLPLRPRGERIKPDNARLTRRRNPLEGAE